MQSNKKQPKQLTTMTKPLTNYKQTLRTLKDIENLKNHETLNQTYKQPITKQNKIKFVCLGLSRIKNHENHSTTSKKTKIRIQPTHYNKND